ncbi:hypothetical protein LV84_03537 [Algoriphagus ratkowskyi]|uniref:VWA domain-containing protein n=1 Tax=Algoriphagus ratkowskyi TaxID=57028 RepID=A0A2W7QU24_9BACT|nr:VWA domain-containing protein [Algoriphagus ratkowskyi]PZX52128.1 hypothetical protein LV84_03537 [Algoriphagus ratkowskyi]TXD76109.1 VWA domain-containing protein [Algoriphagus ratkowskyi]
MGIKLYLNVLFLFLIVGLSAEAQVKERRIYILDGTKSMMGYNGAEDVWERVKSLLNQNITNIDEGKSDIILVVFADKIYEKVKGKQEILKFLKSFKPEYVTPTNITIGWKEIENLVDPSKFNFITFLTDGEHNDNSALDLPSVINDADRYLGENNAFACFVRLTPKAIDPKSSKILESAKNISFIDGIKFPSLIRPSISKLTVNLREPISFNQKLFFEKFNDLDFPENFSIGIDFINNSDSFKVNNPTVLLTKADGIIPIDLEFSGSISPVASTEIINSKIELRSLTPNVILISNEVEIEFINKPEKLAQITINPDFGILSNYPSFLFWSNKTDTVFQTVSVDWSEDAKLSNSSLNLNLKLDGLKDSEYGLVVDGYPQTSKEIEFLSSENAKEIGFFINERMQSGIMSGIIQVSKIDLDRTNVDEPLTFEIKLNTNFNPLKVTMFWVGVIILGFLLFWFLILRNQIYKKFHKASIQITDPYFKSFRVGGCRKMIFSSYPIKQNSLSTIFKGRLHNEVNPIWVTPLTFLPGKNKTDLIKVVRNQEFTLDPYSIFLKRYGEYNIKDKSRKIIKIKIS